MNGFLWMCVGLGAVLVVGALVTFGVLLERERLQNPDGERGPKWWGALVVSSIMWPFVAGLWPDSRPVPPPQPELMGPPRWREVPPPPERELLPEDEASMYRGPYFIPAGDKMAKVERPTVLAVLPPLTPGDRVFVESVGLVFVRGQMHWAVEGCGCRYNFSGFPVIMCRQHRSDADPQGEPDESEGDVGL